MGLCLLSSSCQIFFSKQNLELFQNCFPVPQWWRCWTCSFPRWNTSEVCYWFHGGHKGTKQHVLRPSPSGARLIHTTWSVFLQEISSKKKIELQEKHLKKVETAHKVCLQNFNITESSQLAVPLHNLCIMKLRCLIGSKFRLKSGNSNFRKTNKKPLEAIIPKRSYAHVSKLNVLCVCTSKWNVCRTDLWHWGQCHSQAWKQVAAAQCLRGTSLSSPCSWAVPNSCSGLCYHQHPNSGPSQHVLDTEDQAVGMVTAERCYINTVQSVRSPRFRYMHWSLIPKFGFERFASWYIKCHDNKRL